MNHEISLDDLLSHIDELVGSKNYQNPKPLDVYDFVVIGGGTAGLIAALGANALGAKVALIEERHLGGDCLNSGCVPSKGLISIADKFHKAKSFLKGNDQDLVLETKTWIKSAQEARAKIAPHDASSRFVNMGLDIFFGRASFENSFTMLLDGQTKISFKKCALCTGASPRMIEVKGVDSKDLLSNESIFLLPQIPEKLLVIGSGPIGCELAQSFARLGSKVVMVTMSKALFEFEEKDIQDEMHQVFSQEEIDIHFSSTVERGFEKNGLKHVALAGKSHGAEIPFDKILISIGRVPNVSSLGLEKAGVQTQDGKLIIDDYLRTTQKHIFASGDILGRSMFTHHADAQSRALVQNAWTPIKKKAEFTVPKVTYTSPEIASVFAPEFEKSRDGLRKISMNFSEIDRFIVKGEKRGIVHVYVNGKGIVKGASIMHSMAGELLPQVQIAMKNNMKLSDFSSMIYAYPTQSEIFRRMGDQERAKGFTPFLQKISKMLVKWMA